jgi:hypothetical protein
MRHRKLRQAGPNVSHRLHTKGGEIEEQHGSSGEHHANQAAGSCGTRRGTMAMTAKVARATASVGA